jgi:predicted MFS family arabinose efflux permease
MQFTAARAFGPALAGFVLAALGAGTAFLFNAVTFLLVLAALATVQPRVIELPPPPSVIDHLRAGVRYVWASRALVLPVLTIFILSFFGSSVVQLAAPIAKQIFEVGETEYGFLVAAFGTGAVLGTLVTLVYGDRVRRSRMALGGLVLFSIGQVVLGSAPVYAIALGGLFSMGWAYVLVAVSLNTSIQARVDEDHRGRVLSIYLMGLFAGVPFGALLAGVLASAVGLRAVVIGGGAVLLGFAVLAIMVFDAMQPLDEVIDPAVHADALLTAQPLVTGVD